MMRRLVLLAASIAGVGGSWLAAAPAQATPDNVVINFKTEAHVNGKSLLTDTPYGSASCGNAVRKIVCDTLMKQGPHEVVVGNAQNGASLIITTEPQSSGP